MIALPVWRLLLRVIAPIRPREAILIGEPADVQETLAGLRLADDRRSYVSEDGIVSLDRLADPAVQAFVRDVEEVILVSPQADARLRLELLRIRGPRGFLMLASHVDALLTSRVLGWIGDQPLVAVSVNCGYGLGGAVKRASDIAVAAVLVIITAPVWLVTLATIWILDGRPLIIRQQRVGLRGVPYGMLKFRSMRGRFDSQPPSGSVVLPEKNDFTRAGALLRRYHIDELPQLINVLCGHMSVVGPRPERPELVVRILRDVPDFDLRSLVRPGIAGLAQVSSEYDTRPEVKLRYDLMYMCDWSVWLDLSLMLRAVSSSLAGTGQ
jgi:lipopolysaccharide/colanic/teichoic acid biosynthesis glycosyltransferase